MKQIKIIGLAPWWASILAAKRWLWRRLPPLPHSKGGATRSRLKRVQYALVLAVAGSSFSHPAVARPWRPSQIPNGDVFGCTTCHASSDGTRNLFGLAVEAVVAPGSEDPFWGPELADLDSDGDDFTNGEELGDPDGDGVATPGVQVTHPANPGSPNTNTITHAAATQTGLKLSWKHGGPPFLIQQRSLMTGTEWMDVAITDVRTAVIPRIDDSALLRVQPSSRRRVTPFTVWLSGSTQQPEPVSTPGAGFGILTLQGKMLTARIRFSGLSANASAAHIHGPAGMADVADVMISATDVPDAASGVIEASMDLSGWTGEQLAAFMNGLTYLNILTPTHPEGEIRGQIAPLQQRAVLTGDAERPDPVFTTGTGSGRFWIVGNELTYEVGYANLSAPAIAAHLHGPADADSSADVLIPFQPTGGALGTAGTFSGTASLSPEQLHYVLEGLTYVNVHTSNHTEGEIRGQVIP